MDGFLSMIYTVKGTLNVSECGNVLMHEHIGCIANDLLDIFKDKWLDKKELVEFAVKILKNLKKQYGVGLFVDGTPIDLGRDVFLIKEVSEKADIPIVVSSGLYYFPSLYTSGRSEAEIASWFIKEFEEGIEGTNIKPGILKAASDGGAISSDNKKRLTAMGIVQKETNLPIYLHSAHNGNTKMQLEILQRNISDSEKIIVGHTGQKPDAEYLEGILSEGCYICMDQCHCTNYSMQAVGNALAVLCKRGYSDKILLSNDLCIYSDFTPRANNGLNLSVTRHTEKFGHIFEDVYNSFTENGGREKDWNKMMRENPIKVLNV